MRLSHDTNKLHALIASQLLPAILERRLAIRSHRDQILDDRCWWDDFGIWVMVKKIPIPVEAPPFGEAMIQCHRFYYMRGWPFPDPPDPDEITDRLCWDDDLRSMTASMLRSELIKIQNAIWVHYDIGNRLRTADDDRKLYYDTLPEKKSADFRLPPKADFLGEARAPHAGCPAFWRSHSTCPVSREGHDYSNWGPCPKKQLFIFGQQ